MYGCGKRGTRDLLIIPITTLYANITCYIFFKFWFILVGFARTYCAVVAMHRKVTLPYLNDVLGRSPELFHMQPIIKKKKTTTSKNNINVLNSRHK